MVWVAGIVWSCSIMCEYASSCVHTPLECDLCNDICVQPVCCDVCIWAMAHDTLKIMCALRCMGFVGIVCMHTRIVCCMRYLVVHCVLYGVSWMWRCPHTFHTHHHHFKPSNSIFHTLYQGTTGRQPEQCQFFGCKVKIHFYEKQPFNKKKMGWWAGLVFYKGKTNDMLPVCGVCISMYDKAGLAGQRTITTTTTINIVSVGCECMLQKDSHT